MEPQRSPTAESKGVGAAPFAYGRRRHSVFGTGENVDEAARATLAVQRPTSSQPERHRLHGRRVSRQCGAALEMTAAIHERARLSCLLDGDVLQRAAAAGRPVSASLSLSPRTLSTSLPLLSIEPVAGCLHALRYTRSARAWSTLATGCVAEATRLSEQDNDVIAWAACFILSGDAQRGLLLLESYVVATCVVVHEVLIGVLGRLPKGVNPFSKRRGDANATVRNDATNPYVVRKCLERHNQVLLAWMRHRNIYAKHPPPALMCYDVNIAHTSEAVVRQVALQAMQLIDAVEVQRWYIAALMLYTAAADTSGANGDAASGDGAGTDAKRRGSGGSRKAAASGGDASQLPVVDRSKDTDSVFTQTRRASGGTTGGGAEEETTAAKSHTSASDGYRAPQNLWFRYFFALGDGEMAEEVGSNSGVDNRNNDGDELAGGRPTTPPAVDAMQSSVSSRPSVPHRRLGPHHHNNNTTLPGDGGRDASRKSSFSIQPTGKLARTLSWFRERGRSASHLSQASGGDHLFREEDVATIVAPTWHLPATASLDQEQTCSLLLSHREEWDVYFITAVTAFYTQHYRTCMMAASRFLHWAEASSRDDAAAHKAASLSSGGASPTPPHAPFTGVPGLQPYQQSFAVFLRAWSALQIGERLQAGKDILALLEEKEDTLGYHVGCALALYGLPLPAAKDVVLAAAPQFTYADVVPARAAGPNAPAATAFSPVVQGYLYLLAEAVHASTLLRLGLVRETVAVATAALQRVEGSGLTEEDTLPLEALRDTVVIAATAVEDANTVLDIPLAPHRLVYIAVCPAFFGGLCGSGIRVKTQSATHRSLYPVYLPLYASTRQVVPFHMNRATYLFHSGQVESAWDDACCAVAAADEIAGSVDFAFSDCFPLRVYHFAIHVGLALLESLLAADLKAAKACLADPDDQAAMDEKDAKLQADELLSKEIVHICQDIVQRMQSFYPHSRVTEICRAQITIVCGGKDYVAQAVALSRRYPHSPSAQNVLTLALYFDHHIPEAVDNARKNLQTFPHASEVIAIHRILQKKHVTYNFNYRKLLPTSYKPGSHDRVFTKRMIIVLILLTANLIVLCLTAFVNVPSVHNMPEDLRNVAVRMQLPTVAPLFFAAIFVIHAVVAAVTTKNLIATLLTDLFFVNTPLNRALFCLRCIPLVNLVNALLVSILGNNFLFESGSATFVLYFFLAVLFVPFTTRIWFLPSIDEPDVDFMSWLAILGVDTVVCVFVVVPHIIAAFLEPYMLVLFYFLSPTERPGSEKGFLPPSSSIRRRLLLHAHDSASMPQRFATGSGSRFLHILVLKWLYLWSHCTMETRFLAEAQLEAEGYRVFPLEHGETAEMLYAHVSLAPLCAPIATTEDLSAGAGGEANDPRTAAGAGAGAAATAPAPDGVGDGGAGRRQSRRSASPASLASGSPLSSSTSSRSFSSSSSGSESASSDDDDDDEEEEDGTAGELDGTLLAGVRTVDAMRQLLNKTSRGGTQGMRHTASFVRPNQLHSFGSTFGGSGRGAGGSGRGGGRRSSEESDGDDGDGVPDSNGPPRCAGSSGGVEAGNGANGSGAFAATTRFSDDLFGPSVELHRSSGRAAPTPHTGSFSGSSGSSSVSGSGLAPYYAGDTYSAAPAAGAAATAQVHTDENYLYPEDYAAENGFGWYAQDAAAASGGGGGDSGNANHAAHYDPDMFEF